MSWNHRVFRIEHPNGEVTFGVHESYYHDRNDALPHSATATSVEAQGETLLELADELSRMVAACSKPVLAFDGNKIVEWRAAK